MPDPPEAGLAALLDKLTRDRAVRYGWSETQTSKVRVAMRVLLGLRSSVEPPILGSDIARLVQFKLPVRAVVDVIDEAGLLHDDRTPTIEPWFERQITGLPTPMADEVRVWFDTMRHGSTIPPRSRPRAAGTIRVRLYRALPILRSWAAAGHESVREISRDEVMAALPTASAQRAGAGTALRSIFGTLKARKIILTNPIARTNLGTADRPTPLPIDLENLRAALDSLNPSRAALAALIAFHGLRPAEIRDLHLTDIRDGRLHLPDRVVPLAQPVQTRIARYLDHRTHRWPHCTNPYLFVNLRTGINTGPVSRSWVNTTLGMAAQDIRQDRILDEAHATGGDVRRICDLFGITVHAATHYTSTLDHPALKT